MMRPTASQGVPPTMPMEIANQERGSLLDVDLSGCRLCPGTRMAVRVKFLQGQKTMRHSLPGSGVVNKLQEGGATRNCVMDVRSTRYSTLNPACTVAV